MSDGFIYVIACGDNVKIGYSVDPARRMVKLQSDNAGACSLLGVVDATTAQEFELHECLEPFRISGEWYPRGIRAVEHLIESLRALPTDPDEITVKSFLHNHPLQSYREAKGLTATELATRLGVQRNTIWRWENRKRRIDPNLWQKIHEETGIPIATLATAKIPSVEAAE